MSEGNLNRAQIGEDELILLVTAFKLYNISKSHKNVYKDKNSYILCQNLIKEYYSLISPDYIHMIASFKEKYISNESLIEKNNTEEELEGLSFVYDYIENFDVSKDFFSIFTTSLVMHNLLYKSLDEKISNDIENKRNEIKRLYDEARKENNLYKLRTARELSKSIEHTKFGGSLRKGDVVMNDFDVEIPSSGEAISIFNSYLNTDKVQEYLDNKSDPDIFNYVRYCVKTIADLIAIQPFEDGNKRVFRALLNLMFKERNLPPVYINISERDAYHEALRKAISNKDYEDLITFYYFKICDSIYELDFIPYLENKENMSLKEI